MELCFQRVWLLLVLPLTIANLHGVWKLATGFPNGKIQCIFPFLLLSGPFGMKESKILWRASFLHWRHLYQPVSVLPLGSLSFPSFPCSWVLSFLSSASINWFHFSQLEGICQFLAWVPSVFILYSSTDGSFLLVVFLFWVVASVFFSSFFFMCQIVSEWHKKLGRFDLFWEPKCVNFYVHWEWYSPMSPFPIWVNQTCSFMLFLWLLLLVSHKGMQRLKHFFLSVRD